MARSVFARLLAALADATPSVAPEPVHPAGRWGHRLLAALADATPAFTPGVRGQPDRLAHPDARRAATGARAGDPDTSATGASGRDEEGGRRRRRYSQASSPGFVLYNELVYSSHAMRSSATGPASVALRVLGELGEVHASARRLALPVAVLGAVDHIVEVLERTVVQLILSRAAYVEPEQGREDRLVVVEQTVRVIGRSIEMYFRPPADLPRPLATGEFADQLRRIGAAVDQLASDVRDTYSFDPRRIEELTEELSRRFPPPQQ